MNTLNQGRWWLLPILLLPFLFMNCSHSGGGSGSTALSYPAGLTTDPNTIFTINGQNITVFQDKQLSFSPTSGAQGTYTISSLPAWASFDPTTGTIAGSPHHVTDTGNFTITDMVAAKVYGPYSVNVIGDVLKDQQWHLLNVGQNAYALSSGMTDQDIHLGNAVKNNIFGTNVRVAISDSGVLLAHPDLLPNVLVGESRSYLNPYTGPGSWSGDPSPSTANADDSHGTAVAGLFAAKGWNAIGGRGVAPESHFAAFLFIQAQDFLAQQGLLDAGLYDQFTGNFDVFNFSWGDPQCELNEYGQSFADKIAASTTQQRAGKGSINVMASGNYYQEDVNDCNSGVAEGTDIVLGNSNFSELNTTPYTIQVAAVNASGVSSSYSSPGSNVWISSTGGEFGYSQAISGHPEASQPALVTTDYPGCQNGLKSLEADVSAFDAGGAPNTDCFYVSTMNGTSGATPIAGGMTALLLGVNPNLTWRDVKYILAKTSDVVNANVSPSVHPVSGSNLPGHTYEQGWVTNTAGFHFMNWYGFGRINVDNAIALAKAYNVNLGNFQTTGWKYSSGPQATTIPDRNANGVVQSVAVTDALTTEAVQLRLSVSDCASDMGVELTSPGGTKSILMNINSRLRDGAIQSHIFLSNAFYGESTRGTWTVRVLDGQATCVAQLQKWELNFYGH